MCVVPTQKVDAYCQRVNEAWDQHLETLYELVNAKAVYEDAKAGRAKPGAGGLLDLLFCITLRPENDSVTPKEMLDVVSRIRNNHVKTADGGIHRDRRMRPRETPALP